MLNGTYLQFFSAILFGSVFLFLWQQSRVVYFRYWAIAWVIEAAAWLCTLMAQGTGSSRWLGAQAFFEFGFALSILVAAQVGAPERVGKSWLSALRALYFFPAFVLVLELIGWRRSDVFGGLRSLVLSAIYFYSFRRLGFGIRKLFHFAMLALSLLYFQNAVAYVILATRAGAAPRWMAYMNYISYYDLALKTVLAFAAMAMWIESQNDRVQQIGNELDQMRRGQLREPNLDYLTGLCNQDALQRRMDSDELFSGVVAVCDLDEFKSVNDRFGHTVGDEVLRNVGSLLRSSIRPEDTAYRWGGDEFAILFSERGTRPARERMLDLEARLQEFRVRGCGALQIRFSWGVAEGMNTRLRDVLDEADSEMYRRKRERASSRMVPLSGEIAPAKPGQSGVSSTSPTS